MEKYEAYWGSICKIYFLTKHYLLLAEELSEDFDTFVQPLKEHRDAFDHIARVYGYKFLESEPKDIDVYCQENMKKAIGHVYRGFFDTADFFSYVCRKNIRELLSGKSREEILKIYPKYSDAKNLLIEIPEKIAQIRENKDINESDDKLVKEVEEYREILNTLFSIYKELNNLFG